MRALVLLLVSIFCLAKFVKSYGVSEHRIDYFKTVDGHEYNYHYHDGLAPRFEKSKLLQPQQQLLLRTKRPQTYKQPYHNKFFATVNEPTFANSFQQRQQQIQQLQQIQQQQQQQHRLQHPVSEVPAVPAPTYASLVSSSSFQQLNSIPTFESHEKIRHSYVDEEEEDSEEGVNSSYEIKKQLPLTMAKLSSKNAFVGNAGSLHGLQVANQHRLNAQAQHSNKYNSYEESSLSSGSSEETNQATPTVTSPLKTSSIGFLSNESAPEHLPGFHYISSGYTYFNSHPQNQKFAAIPVEPPAHKIRKPYVAPTLTTPAPSPSSKYVFQNQRPAPTGTTNKPVVPRRPYIAPALTTTKRPYVAPSVDKAPSKTQSDAFQLLNQNHSQQNGASRFRYTTARTVAPTASKQQSELYEPEFDIDIRIDLSSDSP